MKAYIVLISFIIVTSSCLKENIKLPTVTTSPIVEVTWEYALSGGEVIDDGGSPVITRGVCATEYPFDPPSLYSDFSTWHTSDSSGIGSYSSKIQVKWHGAALSIRDTHYLRAYASNREGTAYGELLSFYPKSKPPTAGSIELKDVTVSATSASIYYQIDVMPRYTVDERGICYNTSSDPTIIDDHILISNAASYYSNIIIENLIPNTSYFARGYVKNESAIYYSPQLSFRTTVP
jgi:hypothetical protein